MNIYIQALDLFADILNGLGFVLKKIVEVLGAFA